MSPVQITVFAAVIGLCIGSFLNVVIYRVPRGESLLRPASRCPKCGEPLAWFDNIPIVSWFVLRGRCRRCGAPISMQYPIVEAVTAGAFVVVALTTPAGFELASRLVLTAVLIALFVIDLELHILPNVITLPGIVIGFLFSLFAPPGPLASAIGILVGGGILYAIAAAYYFMNREEGMGMGDVKMLAMIGAFLGWRAAILTVLLASFAGALVGVVLLTRKDEGLKYALPFGSFLAMAAFLAMLFEVPFIEWYFSLTRL